MILLPRSRMNRRSEGPFSKSSLIRSSSVVIRILVQWTPGNLKDTKKEKNPAGQGGWFKQALRYAALRLQRCRTIQIETANHQDLHSEDLDTRLDAM